MSAATMWEDSVNRIMRNNSLDGYCTAHGAYQLPEGHVTMYLNVRPTNKRAAAIRALEANGYYKSSAGVWCYKALCYVFIEHYFCITDGRSFADYE